MTCHPGLLVESIAISPATVAMARNAASAVTKASLNIVTRNSRRLAASAHVLGGHHRSPQSSMMICES
jgi:hypothetical protein